MERKKIGIGNAKKEGKNLVNEFRVETQKGRRVFDPGRFEARLYRIFSFCFRSDKLDIREEKKDFRRHGGVRYRS